MFDNLVESGSHKDDISRKGAFLLGTFVIYSIVLVALGILSIYLVNSNLPDPSYDFMTMLPPVQQPPPPAAPEQAAAPKPKAATDPEISTREADVRIVPPDMTEAKEEARADIPLAPKTPFVVDPTKGNRDVASSAAPGPQWNIGGDTGGGGGPAAPVVVDSGDAPPPPPAPTPAPKKNVTISGGVLNGKAISKPAPAYPPIAKAARASGAVTVQITVDESGRVVSAQAVSGHPLLQQAAANAVRNWRFTPTLLSGQPVKVSGQVIVNFNLQ